MAARFFLCVMVLVAVSLLLSGCGGKSGCDWKLEKFEEISKSVASAVPFFSSDGKTVTCHGADYCAVIGAFTPLRPGDHPHELDEALCNGTYSYTLKVEKCGDGGGKVGWHTNSLEYSTSSMGVGIYEAGSCAEVGWKCGCSGSVDGGKTTKHVSGDLTLEVTMNTTEWPWYRVRFLAPPGATASKGTQLNAPVEPKGAMDNIDDHGLRSFHPLFVLEPGAVFSLPGKHSSPDSGRLAGKSDSTSHELQAPLKPALVV